LDLHCQIHLLNIFILQKYHGFADIKIRKSFASLSCNRLSEEKEKWDSQTAKSFTLNSYGNVFAVITLKEYSNPSRWINSKILTSAKESSLFSKRY